MGKGQKKNQQFSQKQVPDLVVKKATVRAKKLKLSEQSVQKFTRITRSMASQTQVLERPAVIERVCSQVDVTRLIESVKRITRSQSQMSSDSTMNESGQYEVVQRWKYEASQSNSNDAKHITRENTMANSTFKIQEIVFCKLRGYCHWPGKIIAFENEKILIKWYNDYRYSKVHKNSLFKFSQCTSLVKNPSIALETAIKEALIELSRKKKN